MAQLAAGESDPAPARVVEVAVEHPVGVFAAGDVLLQHEVRFAGPRRGIERGQLLAGPDQEHPAPAGGSQTASGNALEQQRQADGFQLGQRFRQRTREGGERGRNAGGGGQRLHAAFIGECVGLLRRGTAKLEVPLERRGVAGGEQRGPVGSGNQYRPAPDGARDTGQEP